MILLPPIFKVWFSDDGKRNSFKELIAGSINVCFAMILVFQRGKGLFTIVDWIFLIKSISFHYYLFGIFYQNSSEISLIL